MLTDSELGQRMVQWYKSRQPSACLVVPNTRDCRPFGDFLASAPTGYAQLEQGDGTTRTCSLWKVQQQVHPAKIEGQEEHCILGKDTTSHLRPLVAVKHQAQELQYSPHFRKKPV